MSKKKSHKGGRKGRFKIWYATLVVAIACWVMMLVMYLLMLQEVTSLSIDIGNLFGDVFGTIGAIAGVASIYSEWMSIFMWFGIGFTAGTIVLAILKK